MKNQREIYQALLDGKTIINTNRKRVKLDSDDMQDSKFIYNFAFPKDWEIYDEYHKLKKAFKEGAYIEFYSTIYNDWRIPPYTKPLWRDGIKYRIKGDISIDAWNKWKEVIKAYWNGKTIEYIVDDELDEWSEVNEPHFLVGRNLDYRIKPKPILYYRWKRLKKDVVEVTKEYYSDDYPIQWLVNGNWVRIEPGKTFEEIG